MASDREFSWRRSFAWTVALGLHVALLVPLTIPEGRQTLEALVEEAPLPSPAWMDEPLARVELSPSVNPPRPRAARPIPTSPRIAPPREAPDASIVEPSADAARREATEADIPVARPLVYLDDAARPKLPDEPLFAAQPKPREGDWFTPGDGSEDDVFYRPLALDPQTTRFAKAWRPPSTLLSEWLGTLVEATSGKASVPLNAKFNLVCGGSIVGLGGACMIVRNGGTGVIVQRPPPAPWDRSNRVQCRELRRALDAAEEAGQVAYLLDRLTALCSTEADPAAPAADDGTQNDEARRGAGLRGAEDRPVSPAEQAQRDL